jgi:hypothetical protein
MKPIFTVPASLSSTRLRAMRPVHSVEANTWFHGEGICCVFDEFAFLG